MIDTGGMSCQLHCNVQRPTGFYFIFHISYLNYISYFRPGTRNGRFFWEGYIATYISYR